MHGNSARKVFKAQSLRAAKSMLRDYREVNPQSRAELYNSCSLQGSLSKRIHDLLPSQSLDA
jgi:hypothetical protein